VRKWRRQGKQVRQFEDNVLVLVWSNKTPKMRRSTATRSASSFCLLSRSTRLSSTFNLSGGSSLLSSKSSLVCSHRFNATSSSIGKKERPILMIPGPIEFSEAVLAVLAEPTMSHVSPEFIEIFGSTLGRVRQVFLASKDSQPFVIAGSGTSVRTLLVYYDKHFLQISVEGLGYGCSERAGTRRSCAGCIHRLFWRSFR